MVKAVSIISILLLSNTFTVSSAHAQRLRWVNPTFQKVMDVLTSDNSQSLVMNVVIDNAQFAGLRFTDNSDGVNHDANVEELIEGKVVTRKSGYDILTVLMDYKSSGLIKFIYTRNVLLGSHGVISGFVAYDTKEGLFQMEDQSEKVVKTAMIYIGNLGIRSIELH